jgi:phosphoglycerol transferase MdoB-like AlkP superfamily enzyme
LDMLALSKLFVFLVTISFLLVCSFLLVLIIETVNRKSFLKSYYWIVSYWRSGCITILVLWTAALTLTAIIGTPAISIIILASVVLCIVFINTEKMRYLDEPLHPRDFLSLRQIMMLKPLIKKSIEIKRIIYTFIKLCIGSSIFLIVTYNFTEMLGVISSDVGIYIFLLSMGLIISHIAIFLNKFSVNSMSEHSVLEKFNITNIDWNMKENIDKNGLILSQIINIRPAIIKKPVTYGKNNVINLMNKDYNTKIVSRRSINQMPNIIIIMNEAFWDPSLLPNVDFSSDPMSFTKSLLRKNGENRIFSPVYGGYTSNVEFEALTGLSNYFLPRGSIPYQHYISDFIPSLPSLLRQIGYETSAIHPFDRRFYRRDKVYRWLGFEKFLDINHFKNPPSRGVFIEDVEVMRTISNLMNNKREPQFIFAVTMQNHGPYEPKRYNDYHLTLKSNRLQLADIASLQTYAEGIYAGDAAFGELYTQIESSNTPTLLIMFGDHLPLLGYDFDIYRKTGMINNIGDPKSKDIYKLRRTPLVIWNNFTENIPVGTISPLYIPNIVMDKIGIHSEYYNSILKNAMSIYPIIDKSVTKEIYNRESMDNKKLLDNIELIQYDILFGKKISNEKIFNIHNNYYK